MIIGADLGIGISATDLPENVLVMQVGVGISARIGHGARVGHIMPRGPRGLVKVLALLADYALAPVVEVIETEIRPLVRKAAPLAHMVVQLAVLVVVQTITAPVANTLRALAGRVVRFAISFEGRFTIASYLTILAFSTYTAHRLVEILAR